MKIKVGEIYLMSGHFVKIIGSIKDIEKMSGFFYVGMVWKIPENEPKNRYDQPLWFNSRGVSSGHNTFNGSKLKGDLCELGSPLKMTMEDIACAIGSPVEIIE